MMQRTRLMLAVACLAGVLATQGPVVHAQQQQKYETPQPARAADVLAKSAVAGPHFKIRPTVAYDGYMYRFTVDSDYGPFEVTGYGALRKLMSEIRAITALRDTKNLKAYGEGLKKSTGAPLRFVRDLAVNPVDTLSGVPKGTYQIMENVGESVSSTRNPAQDSRAQEVLKFSAWKRDHANRLGVDPYSRNAVLQKELNAVAWAATAGDWTTSLVLMPVGGPGVSVVTGLSMSDSVKNALKQEPPARLRIINPDGSEAELSGNGARQAVLYLRRNGWTDSDTFSIQTAAGEIRPRITGESTCTVAMGRARLSSKDYPSGPEDGTGTLAIAGRELRFQHVSIGNPQCAIEVQPGDELERLDLAELGPPIESSELFPNRTNVSFWRRDGDREITARIFERGVGETMSSGTGASGAAVAAVLGGLDSPVTVHLEGGDLEVGVGEDLSVELSGWAVPVCRGELAEELVEELRQA